MLPGTGSYTQPRKQIGEQYAGIAAAVFCCLLLRFPEFLPAPVSSSIPIPACAVVVLSAHVDATFQIYSKAFRHLGK